MYHKDGIYEAMDLMTNYIDQLKGITTSRSTTLF